MMTGRTMLSRNFSAVIIAAVAVGAVVLAVAMGDDRAENGKADTSPIANLKADNARTRDLAVMVILEDHRKTVKELIAILEQSDGKKYSDGTRAVAAFILGKMRAAEAVPALSKALKNPPKSPGLGLDINPYDMPIWTALVRIGRPAVPAMIENIEQTDDDALREESLSILCHILGGKKHLLELLGKLRARTQDEDVVKRVAAATAYCEKHYKEDGEQPLY